jgi:hypothetical protein
MRSLDYVNKLSVKGDEFIEMLSHYRLLKPSLSEVVLMNGNCGPISNEQRLICARLV